MYYLRAKVGYEYKYEYEYILALAIKFFTVLAIKFPRDEVLVLAIRYSYPTLLGCVIFLAGSHLLPV